MLSSIIFSFLSEPVPQCHACLEKFNKFENYLWPMKIDWINLIVWGTWPEQLAWKRRKFDSKPICCSPIKKQQKKEKLVKEQYPIEKKQRHYEKQNKVLRKSSRLIQPR